MARGKSNTGIKFEDQLRDQITVILRQHISDPKLQFVSITKVELSPEKSWAKVYWDTFDSNKRGDVKKALEGAVGTIKTYLSKSLKVRVIPQLKFEYDSSFESENEIDQLLKSEAEAGKKF